MREGDAVPAGATLLRQELGSMQARLDQAVATRNVAERRLAELVKGPRAQEITEARAALESARSMLDTETREFERVQVRGIVLRGAGLAELQVPIYKLLAFTAVALTVVTLRFHKRLD